MSPSWARRLTWVEYTTATKAEGPWTSHGDWILIKASRGIRLERAVEALRAMLATAPATATARTLEAPP